MAVPDVGVQLVSGDDVAEAATLLEGVVRRTPLEHSRALAERVGGPVWLKCENLQHTGSFKFRGAYTRLSRLTAGERARGVVAASAGNHAQGVALAAKMLGIRATVFMPENAPLPKVAATRSYGADARLGGLDLTDALAAAVAHAEETGAVFIHPFEHPDVIAGQGTVGLELLEQCPDAATVVVCTGGGGLVAGCALAMEAMAPGAAVWAVEPEGWDDTKRSLDAGERLANDGAGSGLCDALLSRMPGALTFPINRRLLAGAAVV
ncbi:MAG TPA: threonine/serine dehydratase, partial [Geodermatophilus sp.]|nr:threonine/serine dehydratase [Geodermatophilus sp.]